MFPNSTILLSQPACQIGLLGYSGCPFLNTLSTFRPYSARMRIGSPLSGSGALRPPAYPAFLHSGHGFLRFRNARLHSVCPVLRPRYQKVRLLSHYITLPNNLFILSFATYFHYSSAPALFAFGLWSVALWNERICSLLTSASAFRIQHAAAIVYVIRLPFTVKCFDQYDFSLSQWTKFIEVAQAFNGEEKRPKRKRKRKREGRRTLL